MFVTADPREADFYDLRPDVVLDAVESSLFETKKGVRATGRTLTLNSLENRVYELEFEDGSAVVTKFFRPHRWKPEQILEEHAFLFSLEADEIPAVTPLRLNNSDYATVCDNALPTLAQDTESDLLFTVFPKVKGRIIDELTLENVEILGRYVARIHAVGRTLDIEHRLELNCNTFGWQNLDYLYDSHKIDLTFESKYMNIAEEFLEITNELLADADYQLVHGDCHLGNTLWQEQSPFFLDFDDAILAPRCQDIWMTVPGRDDTAEQLRARMLQGYRQMGEIEDDELRFVEPLRGLRMIHYSAWIARRINDPAFRLVFPHFLQPSYWEEEIRALEEVCRLID